ncbi:hypothetical protein [Ammoniphilus resinae]|uniref:DUF465 domain-containing protein n=1 Tax=Ammoniphilus resinae TaxID=861532 RepID=A0ABS4GV20_9BACL|nr:hypothetical protein [Ammoniphilus resinae]MBP1934116.1 hypothetical protein [Ammoniphilus resinae]
MAIETVQEVAKKNQVFSQMENDLQEFVVYLNTVCDLEKLHHQKEMIKESVKDPQHWQARILLYKKVQLINERLAKLSN